MQDKFPYSSTAHQAAVLDNIIPYRVNPAIDAYLGKLAKERIATPLELQRLAEQSETTDWREHSWGLRLGPDNPPDNAYAIGDWVELARIRCFNNFITTIRKVDTTVTTLTGVPVVFHDKPFYNEVVRFYLWYCDIKTPNNQLLDFRPGPNQFARPTGNPVFQLARFPDNRYSWGSPSNVVTIPGIQNKMIVLFAQIVNPLIPDPGGSPEVFPVWDGNFVSYAIGDIVWYPTEGSQLYICIQAHTSQPTWTPPAVPALWNTYENGGGAEEIPIAVGGRLIASTQSEDSLAAEWQAKRTFHV